MKRVEVVWYDAFDVDVGWTSANNVDFNCPPQQRGTLARTRGWLHSRDDNKVVIAMTWAPESEGRDEDSMRGVFVIPAGMVEDVIDQGDE